MFNLDIKYIGFNDKWYLIFGIPILAVIMPFLFFGMTWEIYQKSWWHEYPEGLVYCASYWLSFRYIVYRLRKQFPLSEDIYKRFGYQFFAVLVITPFITAIASVLIHGTYYLIDFHDSIHPTASQAIAGTYFIIFAILSGYDAMYFLYKYKEAIVEKEQLKQAHTQSQLDNLRNQINPHFLFNSLNTLMNLIPMDSDRAMNYLSKLSKFYRYTVSNQEQTLVPLYTELENTKIYADLLHERFHNGIQIQFPDLKNTKVQILPLCLQLLIENAVKHNIVANKKPLTIQLELIENQTYIQVKNNIQKKIQPVSSTGMGLKNIKNRVAFFTDLPVIIEETETEFKVAIPLLNGER